MVYPVTVELQLLGKIITVHLDINYTSVSKVDTSCHMFHMKHKPIIKIKLFDWKCKKQFLTLFISSSKTMKKSKQKLKQLTWLQL